ncbi:TPA: radical SAM protein, partial [bacterium]|nr:radical SAM protein [bacterium]
MVYINNENEVYELGVYSELNGLLFIVLMWLTFTDFFDNSNQKILPSFITRLINFFAKHKTLHKISIKIIECWFGKIIITIASYILIKKYGNIKKDKLRHLLDKISNIGDSNDDSIKKIIDQIKSNDYRLESLNEGIEDFDLKTKIRLFRHFFYSILIRSFNRSIIKLRYGNHDNYVPNLGVVLLSPIDKCNLRCKGCITLSDRKGIDTPEIEKINYIIEQAKNLNVFHIVITGKGEPFCDQDSKDKLIALAKKHSDLNFLIYTNGTTLQENDIKQISKLINVYLIISVDGLEEINDERRGKGVYQKVINLMKIMKDYKMIFGYCSTVYKGNYQHVTSRNFVYKMANHGCKFGVYL